MLDFTDPKIHEMVTSRKGRVSRNIPVKCDLIKYKVTSRKGRVSRNVNAINEIFNNIVTSRKGRVSRNGELHPAWDDRRCHVPQGACE